ncbi:MULTISPECIES: hypothetical protein [unclassified Acinetobacter]|uniref:hypothetical protein n=1 Tax=unclassified Acinetobacter TaxID=196816 RepID=UPI0007D0A416|nr:hypothetical protein [Acinetobacter sp. SFD]OAL83215.1 hypothetical protein AY605_11290 [Acinetobacter sp. SFD]
MKLQFFRLILIASSFIVMSQTSFAGDGGLRFAEKNQEKVAQIQAKKKVAKTQAQPLQAKASTEPKQ